MKVITALTIRATIGGWRAVTISVTNTENCHHRKILSCGHYHHMSRQVDLISDNQRRWAHRVAGRGYRPSMDPLALLRHTNECASGTGISVMRAMLAETHDSLIWLCQSSGARASLEPELIISLETTAMVFSARLPVLRPSWLMRETFLGRRIRRISGELWNSSTFDDEPEVARLIAAVDSGCWPSAIAADLLASQILSLTMAGVCTLDHRNLAHAAVLLRMLAHPAHIGHLFSIYMYAVIGRAWTQDLGSVRGAVGAHDNLVADVAWPTLRALEQNLKSVTGSRPRLCRARHAVIERIRRSGQDRHGEEFAHEFQRLARRLTSP